MCRTLLRDLTSGAIVGVLMWWTLCLQMKEQYNVTCKRRYGNSVIDRATQRHLIIFFLPFLFLVDIGKGSFFWFFGGVFFLARAESESLRAAVVLLFFASHKIERCKAS